MARTGRSWLLAFPLALALGLAVLPLARGSVDDALAGAARAALDEAGVRDVTVASRWAALRLSGPAQTRDAALAAVARMDHRDAVARVAYAVPAGAAALATPEPTASLPPVDVVADLVVAGTGPARTVTLSGTVAGETQHAELLAAVQASAPTVQVVDTVTVVAGDPAEPGLTAWPAFLGVAGPAAGLLEAPGAVHLGADGMTLSGVAVTESAAALIAERVADATGRGISVTSTVVGPLAATRLRLGRVSGLDRVQFVGADALAPVSKKSLDAAARLLKVLPAGITVEIRGFTDNRGVPAANLALSQRRATVVLAYLVSRGVPANRLSARGFGEKQPRSSNGTDAGRAANRRIEFVVKGS